MHCGAVSYLLCINILPYIFSGIATGPQGLGPVTHWTKMTSTKSSAHTAQYGDDEIYYEYGFGNEDEYEGDESLWEQGYSAGYNAAMVKLARLSNAR